MHLLNIILWPSISSLRKGPDEVGVGDRDKRSGGKGLLSDDKCTVTLDDHWIHAEWDRMEKNKKKGKN